ncbi:SAM-dependent methyltransferase [Streptomyces sp. NPDC059853]|uniref:SAM-dependent methyltransferase n=1 Tax=Streptomyces sp. NPDC059853 TaxID=3346973 RepID=UPI003658ADBF
MVAAGYDALVDAAMAAPVEGWDFGWLAGRAEGSDPSWSYRELARACLASADAALDIDTGGGELLAGLAPLPRRMWATEGWAPNVGAARQRLEPLGVTVLPAPEPDALPLPGGAVEVVLNRHGRLAAREIGRVLRPGGVLLTQQVGSDDCAGLNRALGAPPPTHPPGNWDVRTASAALTGAGFRLRRVQEEYPALTFYDIGALIYHLRLVAWQVPGFSPERYGPALRRLHARMGVEGRFDVRAHRFLIVAERPGTGVRP